ncbi:hypothetical protein TIFTF001_030661 [Ficus carica]|uniref:DUF8039 domain-containing protein n=1 Tax=Ficus carica TaxID=3494 RepID=A0AA88DUL1_FICCA|nr:hypothetical protein TIFTF001_030661 [Ficus carica]
MSQDHEEECSTQTHVRKPRRTNSPRFNPDDDGKRRAILMRRVHHVRTKGQRIEVLFDAKGQPLGKGGDELQSWIGVLAREHILIWISDFRSIDLAPKKETVWVEIVTSFTMELSFKKQFKKTGKYADRHTRWLDMRVKPDGQFKKEEFKSIADNREELSQQETQGSFEFVGTEDILTKALGNAEHSGLIRGQSKFVKQSQYFNLVPSSRENDEVSDMKRQLAALERTVQELCAKHGINRETMADETTAPTVDQHNSFKASCTLNEKEAGPSDPNPMPNASKECQLFLPDLVNGGDVLVAIGRAYMDCVPTDTVHGIPLDEENVRVTITVPKLNCSLLPIPTNKATCIEEAVGEFIAWSKIFTSKNYGLHDGFLPSCKVYTTVTQPSCNLVS